MELKKTEVPEGDDMTNESGLPPDNPLTVDHSISIGRQFETSPPLHHRYPYQDVRVSDADRLQHVYMIGMTGTGKSNALKNLIAQDLQNSQKGVLVMSPEHGLLQDLLPHIPEHRLDDLIYFDPTRVSGDHVIGWNPLEFSEGKNLPREAWQVLYSEKVHSVFNVLSQTFEDLAEPEKELLLESLYGLVALDHVCLKDMDTLLGAGNWGLSRIRAHGELSMNM
jgi:DNA helicase HerA-like ATPase